MEGIRSKVYRSAVFNDSNLVLLNHKITEFFDKNKYIEVINTSFSQQNTLTSDPEYENMKRKTLKREYTALIIYEQLPVPMPDKVKEREKERSVLKSILWQFLPNTFTDQLDDIKEQITKLNIHPGEFYNWIKYYYPNTDILDCNIKSMFYNYQAYVNNKKGDLNDL